MTTRDEPPAGGASTGRAADHRDGATPAGSGGAEFRARWKAARAASGKAARRGAGRYVRQADRAAGERWRPGMGRRMPPGGDSAA
jgi:hypothetical protein